MSNNTKVQGRCNRLNEKGYEICDPNPASVSVGFKRPPTLQEQIQRLVVNELSNREAESGHESFDDADDFEVGDDYDPRSKYEIDETLPTYRDSDVKASVRAAVQKELEARGITEGPSGRRKLKKKPGVGAKRAQAPEVSDSDDESDDD